MNKKVLKLKKLLPKDYRVTASKSGLTVYVSHKLKKNELIEDIDAIVRKAAKKLCLDEIGFGCSFGKRDWEFIDIGVEKKMIADAKSLHDNMKAFFKKWSNSYCNSYDGYEFIDKMRKMLESDEN